MSTTTTSEPERAATSAKGDRRRPTMRRRAGIAALVVAITAVVIGGLVVFGWMVDETHFERPSAEFDELAAQAEALPGVAAVEKERWVEAPSFSDPTSWMSVTVDQAGLPGVIELACATDYPDPVSWSLRVTTASAAEVTLHATPPIAGDASRCPDFGFDAVPLVAAIDRVAPGLPVQPSVWSEDRLTFVALEDELPAGYDHLLPLVQHADELLSAAGLEPGGTVAINSANLGALIHPDEKDAYLAMLTELADEHAVSSYWGDSGDFSSDEIEVVQIVAPAAEHTAIEQLIRSSGLRLADAPVRFIEQ